MNDPLRRQQQAANETPLIDTTTKGENMNELIATFVEEVVDGEAGSGSVYVSGFNQESGDEPFLIGVCTDCQEPTYTSNIPGTDDNIKAVEAALKEAGMNVIIDPEEWDAELEKWLGLGGAIPE
jgi:hypothetical protein